MKNNSELIEHLVNTNALFSPQIIDAFKIVDRKDFTPNSFFLETYGDYPLQIGYGQTISQPTTVAMMLEMLEPKKNQKILDIGSGSGWTTALLAQIVGENGTVTGVERLEKLVEYGSLNLKKYNFKNSKIIYAGDSLGIPEEKFDRILVSAAAEELPYELIEQLNPNGILVIPVRNSVYKITKLDNEKILKEEYYGFSFVPLIY